MMYYLLFIVTSVLAFIGNFKFKSFVAIIIFIILALFAGTRLDIDNDYFFYYKLFRYTPDNVKDFLNGDNKMEWCMYVFPRLFSFFFQSKVEIARASILLFAILGVGIKMIAIKKNSSVFFLSIILYVSYLFLMQEMTTIRVGIASAIFLWSIPDFENKNYKFFFIKLLVCFFFHSTSIVLVLAWLVLQLKINIKYLYIAIIISFISAMLKINFLTLFLLDRIFPRVAVYIQMMEWMKEKETNIFSFRLLFALGIVIVFGIFYQKLKEIKYFEILFKLHLVSICFFLLLSTSAQVFSIRTFELFSVIQILLYPMIIFIFKPSLKFIGCLIIIAFSVLQIVYLIDIVDIYKPYKSWF